jgi:hypothetical protein
MKWNRPIIAFFATLLFCAISSPAKADIIQFKEDPAIEENADSKDIPFAKPDPYYQQHVQYAKLLYKDKWAEHLGDIRQKYSQYMGDTNPKSIDSIAEFNKFFSFVSATNFGMRLHYAALIGHLNEANTAYQGMKRAVENQDRSAFFYNLPPLLAPTGNLAFVLEEAQERLLSIASIYEVPMKKAKQTPQKFSKLKEAFSQNTYDGIADLAKGIPGLKNDLVLSPTFDAFYWALGLILENASFSYERSDGETGFVSFVTFGHSAPHEWGKLGGDGAIDTASFQFLGI